MYAVHKSTKICTNYGIFSAYALERLKGFYDFKLRTNTGAWIDFSIEAFDTFRYPLHTLYLNDGTETYLHGDSPVLTDTGESFTLRSIPRNTELNEVKDYQPLEWYDDFFVPFKQKFTLYSELEEEFLYLSDKRRRPYFDFILSKFKKLNSSTYKQNFYSRMFVNDFAVLCKIYGYYPKIRNELYEKDSTKWASLYSTNYSLELDINRPFNKWNRLTYSIGNKYTQNVYFIACDTFYALGQGFFVHGN